MNWDDRIIQLLFSLVGLFVLGFWLLRRFVRGMISTIRVLRDEWKTLQGEAEGAREDSQATLTLLQLWKVTHRRLDHYHGIALGQAKQSFRNAQIVMGFGFALLISFVVIALNASTAAGSIVAGGLGTVAAALAGYVSRTFVKSQEAAAGHLRAYFDQPLEISRYLAAERLLADAGLSEEKRAEILGTLVQAMVVGPGRSAPEGVAGQQPASAD
ncbi:hypothetical protein ACFY0A_25535 [Streptomyces sp. NPDC001698]|uniref:TRADD-N-associated membrane domain-containing protein n=1 Tax=Streptomyces sp. NPDC001698 TaxID=3364601 RepID=UPI0036B02D61